MFHTQHCRIDDGKAVEEAHDDKGEAERGGEFAAAVALEHRGWAEGELDGGEVLPEAKGNHKSEAECEADDYPLVTCGGVSSVGDYHIVSTGYQCWRMGVTYLQLPIC